MCETVKDKSVKEVKFKNTDKQKSQIPKLNYRTIQNKNKN